MLVPIRDGITHWEISNKPALMNAVSASNKSLGRVTLNILKPCRRHGGEYRMKDLMI